MLLRGIAKGMTEIGLLVEETITEKGQHNMATTFIYYVSHCICRIEGKYYCNFVRKNIKPYLEYSMHNSSFTKKKKKMNAN